MTHITIYREKDIREKWPVISKGIDNIMERMPANPDWSHRHVLGQLMNGGSCRLYIIEKDDKYAGFMVIRMLREEFTFRLIFHVWLLYLEKNGALDEVCRFIIDEAKRQGCQMIRMESNRDGWEKIFRKYGGGPRYTIYEKEI